MEGFSHGIAAESKIGELTGVFILGLIEDEAVLVVLYLHGRVSVAEDLVALGVHAGDHVAFDGHLGHAADVAAVKTHAFGIGAVLGNGFLAVHIARAHIQQVFNGSFGVLFANQRRNGGQPVVMVFFFGQLGEQLHIGAGNLAEVISFGGLGQAGQTKGKQADQAQRGGKQLFHGRVLLFRSISVRFL